MAEPGARPRSGQTSRVVDTSKPPRFGFGARLLAFVGAALALTVSSTVAVSTAWVNVVTDRAVRDSIARVPPVLDSYRDELGARISAIALSLAEEPGTKALLAPGVLTATRYDWADDTADLLEASSLFLVDRAGVVLARSGGQGRDLGRSLREAGWVAEPLRTLKPALAFIREGKSIALLAAVPIISGAGDESVVDGVLALSLPLHRGHALSLAGMTRGEVLVIANVAASETSIEPVVSAASDEQRAEIVLHAMREHRLLDALLLRGEPIAAFEIDASGERRIVAAQPIRSSSGAVLGAFVVSRSRQQEIAAFLTIRNVVLACGLLALLLALPACLVMGRRMARPLERLAAAAAAVRHGDLGVALPAGGNDEIGTLARAFAEMVKELREKAALEVLLAELQAQRPAAVSTGAAQPVDGESLLADRYELLASIGQGGMGTVFRARDRQLDEDVALKLLAPRFRNEGFDVVEIFKREIRLARRISHPNVVRTHDLGEADGRLFLTMELVHGVTLREIILSRGPIALAPGLQIAKQLCRGLAAIHAAGIIHRDIKPQNIMVLPSGLVKLMDFGISLSMHGKTVLDTHLTFGTPAYMSPEQFKGDPLTSACDIYSVGVVLFELFCGSLPFSGESIEIREKHLVAEPPRLTGLRPDLPDRLEGLILACLAKDPHRRPPSVSDLHGGLMRIMVGDEDEE